MKKSYRRAAVVAVAVVALGAGIAALFYGSRVAAIGTAYAAKILCSGIFVSQRDLQSVRDTDLSADDLSVLRHIDLQVDRDLRQVTATFFGFARRRAVYGEGRGCAVVHGETAKLAIRHADGFAKPRRAQRAESDELQTADKLPPEL